MICSLCKLEHFVVKKTVENKVYYQSLCSECNKAYQKDHYKKNKNSYIKKNHLRQQNLRTKMYEYLSIQSCVDCGVSNPIVLHFDHKDPKEKVKGVAVMLQNSSSWDTILREIAKCDVRCANCHMIRTAKQFNWYRVKWSSTLHYAANENGSAASY